MQRENLREKLNTEITRKQFIQYIGIALLMLFGLHNFLSLLGNHQAGGSQSGIAHLLNNASSNFGSRRFGE